MSKITLILLGLALGATGCLKTRAQLRDDEEPIPNRVEPVRAAGGYAVDELKQEVTRLTGRIEELERAKQAEEKSGHSEQIKALENRMHDLEQGQLTALEAIKKLQADLPPPDAVDVFQKGKEQQRAKHCDDAIKSFTTYLRNPNGKHVEEATFLRGECYYHDKQYKKAIVDYSKFPEKWAKSPFTPKALLKIAQSFEAMGSKEDAQAFYEQILDEYPKAAEAKEAKKKVSRKKLR